MQMMAGYFSITELHIKHTIIFLQFQYTEPIFYNLFIFSLFRIINELSGIFIFFYLLFYACLALFFIYVRMRLQYYYFSSYLVVEVYHETNVFV